MQDLKADLEYTTDLTNCHLFFSLPAPPVLLGPLATNNVLSDAERVHQNLIKGPNSFVSFQGNINFLFYFVKDVFLLRWG